MHLAIYLVVLALVGLVAFWLGHDQGRKSAHRAYVLWINRNGAGQGRA
ncbi:hypothetical protein N789_14690 [Arenimonas oryziterrae DSM 21050 = YC6267]|uniref:Uncharacterized protein n=1 Tax=Arenimonas oryziterrae DSM 21050 = YC6267 TaxID=1121015 RepID=A0A091ASK7_9GAMM|nr:hypothetical protein N789_14690 [Arenimonas oryziterrae DSM 21050 = YC6267]